MAGGTEFLHGFDTCHVGYVYRFWKTDPLPQYVHTLQKRHEGEGGVVQNPGEDDVTGTKVNDPLIFPQETHV